MKPTVYIHTNHKQIAGAVVSQHSLKRASATPDAFNVEILDVNRYPYFSEYNGQNYLRKGKMRPWLFEDLQSFTPSRFMPPELMGYQGKAVVIDPDVFAVGDIMELFNMDMEGKSVRLLQKVKNDGSVERKTSVMLMDCGKLKHWNVESNFRKMFTREVDYQQWLSMSMEDPNTIGDLDSAWNSLDVLKPETKLLHTTRRETQPWKTGLPVDFTRGKDSMMSIRFKDFQRRVFGQEFFGARYKANPDARQVRLFFGLLKECLENGMMTEAKLREEMKKNHVRHDAFKVMKQIQPLPPRERMNEIFQ